MALVCTYLHDRLVAPVNVDEEDLAELTNCSPTKLQLFENGERTAYRQGVHTMEAAKIAEGRYLTDLYFFIVFCTYVYVVKKLLTNLCL